METDQTVSGCTACLILIAAIVVVLLIVYGIYVLFVADLLASVIGTLT